MDLGGENPRTRVGLRLSRAHSNIQILKESELYALDRGDRGYSTKAKRYRRRQLTDDQEAEIVHACAAEFESHADVAARYRISTHLVGRIVREHKELPDKKKRRQCKAERRSLEDAAVADVANALLAIRVPILNVA